MPLQQTFLRKENGLKLATQHARVSFADAQKHCTRVSITSVVSCRTGYPRNTRVLCTQMLRYTAHVCQSLSVVSCRTGYPRNTRVLCTQMLRYTAHVCQSLSVVSCRTGYPHDTHVFRTQMLRSEPEATNKAAHYSLSSFIALYDSLLRLASEAERDARIKQQIPACKPPPPGSR